MTPEQLSRREERARTEPLVVSRTDQGFRVYSATNRSRIYEVTGSPDAPVCSCPDFEEHAFDPDWRCKHILAVLTKTETGDGPEDGPAGHGVGALVPTPDCPLNGSQMLIKRSVSPDGRIDALSVEFSCPVDMGNGEAHGYAARILGLQDAIARRFLGRRNGGAPEARGESRPDQPEPVVGRPVSARIVGIEEGDTRNGRKLFLRFRVGERTLRRYGSWQKLADLVSRAGFPEEAENLQEGTRLDLPCRVVLRRSRDGRYLNITDVRSAEVETWS